MKNSVKWIILALFLVAVIAGATVMYNQLSKDYKNDDITQNSESQVNQTNDMSNTAPDFTILDYAGNEVKLSDYKGKPVVLNFWATWCYYCKEEMPDFNRAYKEYPDVQFLMVNATDGVQETMESAKNYVEQEAYEFDVFFDTNQEAIRNYNVTGFPATFFIDKDGNLVTRGVGMLDFETLEKGIKMITE